jgi:hypothetical protein
MRRHLLLNRIKTTAIGTAICSVATTLAQVAILYLTGGIIIHDFNAQLVRVIVSLYIGSFAGLFSIIHFTSTPK